MLGAVIFKKVEGVHERQVQFIVKSAREKAVDVIWNATFNINRLDAKQWQDTVRKEVSLSTISICDCFYISKFSSVRLHLLKKKDF